MHAVLPFYLRESVMSLEGLNVGEYGNLIELTVKDPETGQAADISSYTDLSVKCKSESGKEVTRDATFVTDGTDGKLEFTFEDGDLDEEGEWKLQAVLGATGRLTKGRILEFYVKESL